MVVSKRTYFVSDVHLGLQLFDPEDRERRFVRFLRSLDPHDTEAIYLLGDIWDFWYEWRDVVPKGYCRVFATLQDLVEAGVKVYFFAGNHDIWCYSYFEELGFIRLTQPYFVEIGGKKFCLGHGDGLGTAPLGYRLMHAVFTCRPIQVLFSMLHPWFAFRLGNTWSRHNRLKHKSEYVFKGESEPLYQFAEEFSRTHDVDYYIFGHFHVSVDVQMPSGARLLILKDWLKSSPYLYFDGISVLGGYSQKSE